MPETYTDRGLIKWRPFDALVGYQTVLSDMKYQRNKIEKPVIDEQQLYYLEYQLLKAQNENLEIEITYFYDGYVKESYGFVIRVDLMYKMIYLDTHEKIQADNIIDIKL
ncbi:MAG TPA: YolD-like family protein [Acholeplasma sp.]|nr:YolD-like family protein [Acholeplasma sp.]